MESFTVQEPTKADYLEFLTLARAKDYARVTWAVEDELFEDFLIAAVDLAETYTRRIVVPKTMKTIYRLPKLIGDGWFGDLDKASDPDGVSRVVLLPYQPVTEVVDVHHGARGFMTLVAAQHYHFNPEQGMLEWKTEDTFSNVFAEALKDARLEVKYKAGFTKPEDANAPESPALRAFRVAVSEIIVFLNDNKGQSGVKIPSGARALLNPYWRSPLNQRHRYGAT